MSRDKFNSSYWNSKCPSIPPVLCRHERIELPKSKVVAYIPMSGSYLRHHGHRININLEYIHRMLHWWIPNTEYLLLCIQKWIANRIRCTVLIPCFWSGKPISEPLPTCIMYSSGGEVAHLQQLLSLFRKQRSAYLVLPAYQSSIPAAGIWGRREQRLYQFWSRTCLYRKVVHLVSV